MKCNAKTSRTYRKQCVYFGMSVGCITRSTMRWPPARAVTGCRADSRRHQDAECRRPARAGNRASIAWPENCCKPSMPVSLQFMKLGEISEISEISAMTSTYDKSILSKSAEKSPRYPAVRRYTLSGAPGAPSARSPNCTLIVGGVAASRCSRLASSRALGTLPLKHSVLIWLRVA